MHDLSIELVIAAAVGGIGLHIALLFLSMRYPTMAVLATLFVLVSPFSLAPGVPMSAAYKLLRIYTTIVMVLIGGASLQRVPLGPCAKLFLGFVIYHFVAIIWSDHPLEAASYKGLFAMLAFSGLVLGSSLTTLDQFERATRILFSTSVIWAALIGGYIVTHPGGIGRLTAFTMNPNLIATMCQFYAIVTLYIALHDRSANMKILAWATLTMHGIIVVYTGSRQPAASAILACMILFLPMAKRPMAALGTGLTVLAVMWVLSYFVHPDTLDRLTSTENTRGDVWGAAANWFSKSPIVGVGWVYDELNPGEFAGANMHCIYLTVACELGLIGLTGFVVILSVIVTRAIKMYRLVRHYGLAAPANFMLAILISTLVGASVESATLMGTTINALFLTLSIGLIDAIPRMVESIEYEDQETEYDQPAYLSYDYDVYEPTHRF